jgi:hypothetical protein
MPFTSRPDSWLHLSGSTKARHATSSAAPASNDSLAEFVSETTQPMAGPDASIAAPVRRNDAVPSPTRIQFSTVDVRNAIRRPTGSQTSEQAETKNVKRRTNRAIRRTFEHALFVFRSSFSVRVIFAWTRRVRDMRRLAPNTRLTSFGGGAAAGVFVMWFVGTWLVGAQPSTSVVPPTTRAQARQAGLSPSPVRNAASNVELAPEPMRPSSPSLPSSTVSINARPVGTSGRSRVASAPPVRPGKAAAARPASYQGSLAFQSAPQGARVFVNGAFVGSTPLILQNLPVGSRAVRIEADGYQRWSASTRVVANQQTRISATLGRARQ